MNVLVLIVAGLIKYAPEIKLLIELLTYASPVRREVLRRSLAAEAKSYRDGDRPKW